MKKFLGFIFAGLAGGLIVLLGYHFIDTNEAEPQTVVEKPILTPVTSRTEIASSVDLTIAAEKTMPTVVHIKAAESTDKAKQRYLENRRQRYNDPFRFFFSEPFRGPKVGYGSGVIIHKDGYIVTNDHVIEFADRFEITMNDKSTYDATIVGRDPDVDLAVLKIESDEKFDYIQIGDSDNVKIGEWVLAVGNPFDLTSTVTAGIVSAKGRSNIIERENAIEDFIQTDAVVNKGNSGGALVDANGSLIGINTAIASPDGLYAGYAFAIPVNIARQVVEDIIEGRAPKVNTGNTDGRPYIGFELEPLNADISSYYDLASDYGLLVYKLDNGGPADNAGVKIGDIIIAVNSNKVETTNDFLKELDSTNEGNLELIINREGDIMKINIPI
ncbi:S1C family serine protease [Membranihabitans maritimus]|uniref:S1C family serine protease n=1 Tax=Membranihabitans maritimus TaxID=2904244 RepID=UPI001F301A45|nr:trypsin-like peptidase domain-containing protein [Membranihabitans maritimus]